MNGDGDLIVTYEDTEGETHEANLGPVSAYTVAKKYGYTGTEQEWEEAIASVGEKSDAAAQSAEDAAASAEEAQAANTAAQAAKTAAQTAQEAAETAAARDVTEWLVGQGLLEDVETPDGRKLRRPTEKGKELGMIAAERTGRNGRYIAVTYDRSAQTYLLDHMAQIAAHAADSRREREEHASGDADGE